MLLELPRAAINYFRGNFKFQNKQSWPPLSPLALYMPRYGKALKWAKLHRNRSIACATSMAAIHQAWSQRQLQQLSTYRSVKLNFPIPKQTQTYQGPWLLVSRKGTSFFVLTFVIKCIGIHAFLKATRSQIVSYHILSHHKDLSL